MKDIRLGFYLVPHYELAKELHLLRLLLYDQFRLSSALNFMTHMTIKGFFRLSEGSSTDEVCKAVDSIMESVKPFYIKPSGFIMDNIGCGVRFMQKENPELQEIHEKIILSLSRFVSTDCEFSFAEAVKERFNPHMTLAMTDIPEELQGDILHFLEGVRFEKQSYPADSFRLFEFSSAGWGKASGGWIDTLEWNIRKSWNIKHSESSQAIFLYGK